MACDNLHNSRSKWNSNRNRYWTAAITVKEGRRPCQETGINSVLNNKTINVELFQRNILSFPKDILYA